MTPRVALYVVTYASGPGYAGVDEEFFPLHRSFSAEAALDIRELAVVEEDSRAVTVYRQEEELRKGRKGSKSSVKTAARPEARIIDDSLHPIRQQDIPRGVWTALLKLRGAGNVQCSPVTHLPLTT